MSEIEGKVVAITGASSGIGQATALLLAGQGSKTCGRSAPGRSPSHTGGPHYAGGRRSNQSVYAATKTAVRVISEGLRQEAGDKLRVTVITPGFTRTQFADDVTNPEVKAQIAESKDTLAMPPDAIARAIVFARRQHGSCRAARAVAVRAPPKGDVAARALGPRPRHASLRRRRFM